MYFCNGTTNGDIVSDFDRVASGIKIIQDQELELLGSPLLESVMEGFARKKFQKISVLISRLSSLQMHYAYFILKNCVAIPKMIYLLRCTPPWKFQSLLNDMDMELKTALEKIMFQDSRCLADQAP